MLALEAMYLEGMSVFGATLSDSVSFDAGFEIAVGKSIEVIICFI